MYLIQNTPNKLTNKFLISLIFLVIKYIEIFLEIHKFYLVRQL